MKTRTSAKAILISLIILLSLSLVSCKAPEVEEIVEEDSREVVREIRFEEIGSLPDAKWQKTFSFPDRLGNVDDTLAMNSIAGFEGYEDQGVLYLQAEEGVESFDLFINDLKCAELESSKNYRIDYADCAINGLNSIQVSNIQGAGKVNVYIPYPVVIEGELEEEGFHKECFELIEDLIASDISYGFPSAQLAIIRHGKLVYANTWGYLNSYDQDGNKIEDPIAANNDTLYDLASVTKMFSVNYAIQKLVSENEISLSDHIYEYLGNSFYEDTLDFCYDFGTQVSLQTQKDWKASLTIEDLLKHRGGFPPSPRYFNIHVDAPSQEYYDEAYNILYSGSEHSEETKQATIEAICQTPLQYEPRTRYLYSDVDYMALGAIVEKITGLDLDTYLKENFFKPMGLDRITYNPLENGFEKDDCAATELIGNTRDRLIDFPGVREYPLQGEVHDEMAWYSMNGISGHAGLFSNATDLAKLAFVMFSGGYGQYRFFDRNVIDVFTSPSDINNTNSAIGWARQGDDQRSWYFGSLSSPDTIGHQGWTGTLVMIDPENDIVMVYLTNERNTPLTDKYVNANDFDGLYYTASTIGFIPEIFMIGLDNESDVRERLLSLLTSMLSDSEKLIPAYSGESHPAYLNYLSKKEVYDKWQKEYGG